MVFPRTHSGGMLRDGGKGVKRPVLPVSCRFPPAQGRWCMLAAQGGDQRVEVALERSWFRADPAGKCGAAGRVCGIPPCQHSGRFPKARHSPCAALSQRVTHKAAFAGTHAGTATLHHRGGRSARPLGPLSPFHVRGSKTAFDRL